MFTLPCSKHNPIKITLKNGETILAKITRFDPETGKVCWKDKAEKWKGSTHCTRVVKATPEEVLAWSKAHEVAVAPLDPCMAGWELGKTKRGPMMMEGYYFAIAVYKDHKKVGELVDEGCGGPVMTRFKNHADEILFMEACRNWCQNNLADGRYADECELFWAWWDEGRPKGISAIDFNKSEREQMLKMFGT